MLYYTEKCTLHTTKYNHVHFRNGYIPLINRNCHVVVQIFHCLFNFDWCELSMFT